VAEKPSLVGRLRRTAKVAFGIASRQSRTVHREDLDRWHDWVNLASDWYWEQDENLHFTYFSQRPDHEPAISFHLALGKTRFEIGLSFESEAQREQHEVDLNLRRPFYDLELRKIHAGGREQILAVSGRPVFGADGRFRGYRGVTRDVTVQKQTLAQLADQQQLLDQIINASANPIVVKDEHHRFIIMNDAACKCLNRRRVDLLGKTDFDIFPEETARRFRESDKEVFRHGGPLEYEGFYPVPDGPAPWMFVRKSAFTRANGTRVIVVAMTDITARRKTEAALLQSERRFRDIAEAGGESVWESDPQGRFSYLSRRVEQILGYPPEQLLGSSLFDLFPAGKQEEIQQWVQQHETADGGFQNLETRFITKSGEIRWLRVNGIRIHDDGGGFTGWRGTASDITQRKQAEERITYLATRDPLTELTNRTLFRSRLSDAIEAAERKTESLAVMFLDLDRFKTINDSLGHHIGDLMLKEVARRLLECVRRTDTVSRLGGDEFIILMEGSLNESDVAAVARKIIKSLSRPIFILDYELHTSCSTGVAFFPKDGESVDALLKHADLAMYAAKERRRGSFQFFTQEMNQRVSQRHRLESALRIALEGNEFLLHFQPQVDIRTGAVVGAEALVRWHHPKQGLILPGEFISVAEETGLIRPLGEWVIRAACEQSKRWQEAGFTSLKMAVNVSPGQFVDPTLFGESLRSILSSSRLDARFLELEMTEGLLLQNSTENLAALKLFAEWGLRIAIDDFGTGYSSLAYLKQLPVDSLKIDRSFVKDLPSSTDDAAIVQAIIAMAHHLNLRVVAEGVETEKQLEVLREMGCDEYQGFLFSKPVTAEHFAELFLRDGTSGGGTTLAAQSLPMRPS
jgi:diguanylate cyclase (GGDEF)-like protein/PAS domain S-box-containing protein